MFAIAISNIAMTSFGDFFEDDQEVLQLKNNYDVCWSEMERRLVGEIPPPDSPEQKKFEKARNEIHNLVRRAMELRKKKSIREGYELLIDNIMKIGTESQKLGDAVTYLVAATHTTGLSLTWTLYYLAENPDIQEKLYQELIDEIEEEKITHETISKLGYLRQVLDETLRCSVLAPYAARFQEMETVLGGHKIPPGTPVIQALGVVQEDPNIWPEPTKFDPERFSPENSKARSSYAFQPFGFAGGRKCPGYQYSYVESTVILSILLRKFKVKLVEGQVIKKFYGLVTKPMEEVWMVVEKRK